MLEYNPQHRISAAIALQHPYFNSIKNANLDEILKNPQGVPLTESLQKIQEALYKEISDL